MIGALALLALTLAPDAPGLEPMLQRAADRHALRPLATLAATSHTLWLVEHRRPDWQRAFYLAPGEQLDDPLGRPPIDLRPLPRLVLHGPTFRIDEPPTPGEPSRAEDLWRPFSKLAVDVSEGLTHALLEAWLDHRFGQTAESAVAGNIQAEFATQLHRRADERMAEVPAPLRPAAFASALADFGAHLLSIANEIYRASERARHRGHDPCRWLDTGIPLFGLWQRSLEEGAYAGRYPALPEDRDYGEEEGSEPASAITVIPASAWRTTRATLDHSDKLWLLGHLQPGAWTGDPGEDFADLCSGSGAPEPGR